jgi:hypothetical protein
VKIRQDGPFAGELPEASARARRRRRHDPTLILVPAGTAFYDNHAVADTSWN